MGWDPSRLALALALALGLAPKKKSWEFFLTGTGLVDPVRDGKFPGNGLMGTANPEIRLPGGSRAKDSGFDPVRE